MTNKTLLEKAKLIASQYLKLESELLSVIMEIDKRKAFRQLGYASLFEFVTEELKLSSAQAYSYINVGRKAHSVPELKSEVAKGLSIYKAQRLTPVITGENKEAWFDLAKTSTQRQLERAVAIASPKTAVADKSTYLPIDAIAEEKVIIKISTPRLQFQFGASEKFALKFRRAQDLVSQKRKHNADYEEVFEAALDALLEKLDPLKKAERQKMRGKLSNNNIDAVTNSKYKTHEVRSLDTALVSSVRNLNQNLVSLESIEPTKAKTPTEPTGSNSIEVKSGYL